MDRKIHKTRSRALPAALAAALPALLLSACGGSSDGIAQLAEARPATLLSCTDLAAKISFPNTRITAAETVAAGTLTVAGKPIAEHCRVTGRMHERVSTVDGQNYAVGFEMRLPRDWNGRFFYQANGGLDGVVSTAVGALGGGPLGNALQMGFAVLSSDAGHAGSLGPFFGLDPQARLDYGYQAVGKLTPMARSALQTAYGKGPDRSYLGGCSNGGRHAMVAASRYADQYDGIIAGNPGTRLPLAAIANIAGAQGYAKLATTTQDLGTGFTQAERRLVSQAVLARCDALDGATDGMVQAGAACQASFDLARDVPTCGGARDGSCLSAEQKSTIAGLFKGATTSGGSRIYSSFPYDAGLDTAGWAGWKFSNPISRDSGAVAFIWQTPPESAASFNDAQFALNGSVDSMLAKVQATNGTFTESGLSLMMPPDYGKLPVLRNRGAKLMVYHGTADPIFSSDDTVQWYDTLRRNHGDAADFARLYLVPGMNHCSGGPATDQFDMLSSLVAWVEKGQAPDRVIASARGAGNAGGANTDLPATWSPTRTRPLCPHPLAARYNGSGDMESAASFSCR
ncbi:Tannase and feruloyl esterase [Delftia acidovorans SPH-1]|jgi:feruloyl esterase|uniref:Tannase and feruloyl esterase n=1 Tax=Delftia acidovorans (strain DSM 14801 / SPH-1) TaxID=398578 RepID=A9C356_DELAS|nr:MULTISPECIES: tannase/feruloyl esterase family alpha/beta hydrolase [Delftia]MBA4003243.1 tannase/feruloyl esterase family alpha/beta hydrolase [Delftia sp.]ABX37167.1 Tannase and feruloyl esterase [Delftia acidovorans SPH-1]MCP4016944.1 tannase/feruloyl esterase family alpha/beta hydrolase [Delftia sp.]MCP4514198.1 tannase/feruloyl esterase family alpha/beta hydrolase [Delftia sp.]MCP4534003.1 tannase/feruloyl esterase family alpha/beta hydrolase [Delftia sp.]